MDNLKSFATIAVAVSICYLSTVLLLAVFEIGKVREQLPQVVTQLENVETGLDVPGILEIVNRVDARLPGILEEVAAVRGSIDGIGRQIPSMVEEIAAVRQQTVPAVLQETRELRQSVPPVLQESAAIRALVPDVLNESANIRATLPVTLDRTDEIVNKLDGIGEHLTENVTKGTVKTLLSAPVSLIEGVVGASDDDAEETER